MSDNEEMYFAQDSRFNKKELKTEDYEPYSEMWIKAKLREDLGYDYQNLYKDEDEEQHILSLPEIERE